MIEKELIEQCRDGDLHNFRKVVEKTSQMVFSVAFRMLGDEESARDAVQDTMVTVWQKLAKIKTAESYRTWVYRIVLNKCYDQLRRRKKQNESRIDDKTWAIISNRISDESNSELDNAENARIISLLTDKLSPKQKTVFILSELEDMTAGEISKLTGMNRTAIKTNLYYARKNIESLLQKYL